ncbi:MAG: segregation/condensation protein A [Actinobacteria bacterium]|nr:segregation/condensation protein A [Actinomycetota bacterium]MDI6829801.1 segregation/condensation protein A [Actinomycetota bacterium]
MPYQVKLRVFEGPFDLLLHLIGRKEIDIYEISLAEITDEYLAYIESMRELDLEVATEFLLIAATLLKLKSDSLLPAPEKEVEELAPQELREELLWRLVEYQKFRNAAEELAGRLEREERYYYRQVDLEEPFRDLVPDVLRGLTLEMLAAAAREFAQGEDEVDVGYIAPIRVNVEDFMQRVRRALERGGRTTFRELTQDCALRIEVIAFFVALLELFKREEIDLRQATRFGDIEICAMGEGGDGD